MESSGKENTPYLSKSLFVRGVRCHKSLYLSKSSPELKDEISAQTQQNFEAGHAVGDLAQGLFPGGVLVPYEGLSHREQLDMTAALISQGCRTIYEAAFSYDDIFIKADILNLTDDGWDMYEVKASTGVKAYHQDELSLQYHVMKGAGLPLSRVFLVHVNNQYVRQGPIDVDNLFHKHDITASARDKQVFIQEEIKRQRAMLQGAEPVIDIGRQCQEPYKCDFIGHCWSHIPSPSVFNYRGMGKPDSFALYRQGIIKMEDVSPDLLNWRQKLQHAGTLYQKSHIDVEAVRTFTQSLWYPLCFMDFETTYKNPIPLYDDTRPYQQVPFQFSLHVIREAGGELEHHEFLADGSENPQKEFIERLLSVIPRDACILAWNKGFEVGRLREVAATFPEKKGDIDGLIENTCDLMTPFKNKSIYHWRFNGSYSIKDVLPALVPELSYDTLDISDGEAASTAWVQMIQSGDEKQQATIRKQLLQYCHLDTLAMVRILESMKNMIDP